MPDCVEECLLTYELYNYMHFECILIFILCIQSIIFVCLNTTKKKDMSKYTWVWYSAAEDGGGKRNHVRKQTKDVWIWNNGYYYKR